MPSSSDQTRGGRTLTLGVFLTRDRWFESGSLQQRVCELSVPERRILRDATIIRGCTGRPATISPILPKPPCRHRSPASYAGGLYGLAFLCVMSAVVCALFLHIPNPTVTRGRTAALAAE
jgi:hypothetical protein